MFKVREPKMVVPFGWGQTHYILEVMYVWSVVLSRRVVTGQIIVGTLIHLFMFTTNLVYRMIIRRNL